jgi:hypothetical protein
MNVSPTQARQAVLDMCADFAAAVATGRPGVINAVQVDIEHVRLPNLIPDKSTLSDFLPQQPCKQD